MKTEWCAANNLKGERLCESGRTGVHEFTALLPSFVELTEDRFIDFLKEHGQRQERMLHSTVVTP